MRKCIMIGCDKVHSARGYCSSHYMYFRINGKFNDDHCSVNDCKRAVYSKELCQFHYQRKRTGKPFDHVYNQGIALICSVEGCYEKHMAKSYCKFHYYRVKMGINLNAKKYARRKPLTFTLSE